MKKHLFLTGPASCDKSAIIRETVGEKLAYAGGFISQKAYTAEGKFIGLELLPAAAAGGVEGYSGELFLDYRTNPPAHDNEVFRNLGVRLLEEAAYYPFAVIDEVGGHEMIIPQFRAALSERLSSDQPIIGVLKTSSNTEMMRRRFRLGHRYTAVNDRLKSALTEDEDTEIVEVNEDNIENVKLIVKQWVKEHLG